MDRGERMKKLYEKIHELLKQKNIMFLLIVSILVIGIVVGVILLETKSDKPKEVVTITIDGSAQYELLEGEQIKLSIKDYGEGTVKWSSSNTQVVSVDDSGNVQAQMKGEAIITAKINGQTATIKISVLKDTSLVSQYSIHVSEEEINLMIGSKVTISPVLKYGAKTVQNAKLQFISQDETIAAVSSEGLVTGSKAGRTILNIYYWTSDGETIVKSVQINVTPDLEYTIDTPKKEVTVGEQFIIKPAVYDNTKKETISNPTWEYESSDETIATVDRNGRVTAKKAGEVEIRAIYETGSVVCDVMVWTKFIATEEDFLSIYNDLSGRYKFVSDVTTKVSSAKGTEIFSGILDGGGYTLTNQGERLFSSVQGDATIRNLTIVAEQIGPFGAPIADEIRGNALVEDVEVHCEIKELRAFNNNTSWYHRANAGIFNYGLGGTIKNCTVYMRIKEGISLTYEGKEFAINQISAICMQGTGAGVVKVDNCKAYSNHSDVQFAIGVTPVNCNGLVEEIPE